MNPAELLARNTLLYPRKCFIRTSEGELTYAQTRDAVVRIAAGLAQRGVKKGDVVAIFMLNSQENVLCAHAVSWLGATPAPMNTGFIGASLIHPLRITRARIAIADAALLPNLVAVMEELPELVRVIVRGPAAQVESSVVAFETLSEVMAAEGSQNRVDVDELDPGTILFTSGTTGPSKACVLSNRYLIRQAEVHVKYLGITEDDVLYCPFPLYHIDAATLTVLAAATVGATAALGARFSASGFWREVTEFGATVFNFMGATLTMLWKRPPSPADTQHRVRMAWGVPMPGWSDGWRERFGFELRELYGLTDAGVVAYDRMDAGHKLGACGKIIEEFEVAITDPGGMRIGIGEPGEIVIRPREPGTIMTEYLGMPAETLQAFRGLWFHTGDLGSIDAEGYLHFHGRIKDSIRRRGENISAFEVEQAISGHPSVLEVAAVGVPSQFGEEDLMVFVVPRPREVIRPEDLIDYCTLKLPAFMVPRYVRIIEEMPKTPTQKVEKYRLREWGANEGVWDREEAGRVETRYSQ